MATKILNSIKYIITIIFLFVGIVYIFSGNRILKDLTLDEKKLYVPKLLKNKTESKEEKLHINKVLNEEKKLFTDKNIIDDEKQNVNEIIITVKKNDTFSKIINPFFSNTRIKNSIIKELNKVYNLRNLSIGQKIFLYKNEEITPIKLFYQLIFQLIS